eukprot:gene589-1142_t
MQMNAEVESIAKTAVCLALSGAGIIAFGKVLKHFKDSRVAIPENKNASLPNLANINVAEREGVLFPYEHERRMNERLRNQLDENDNIERRKVIVRVPATSANVGPGFDTIGMALDLWSEFTVERSDKFEMECEGEGSFDMPLDDTNLVCLGIKAAFKAAGKPVPPLKYKLVNRIPYARGLGSSSAAIIGGLLAGLVLAGHTLSAWGSEEILNYACEIEGHPDNVAPALYGGIQIGLHTGERWTTERVNLPPGMQCICFIPEFIGKTSVARAALPATITRKEAVFNIGRVAWLINALATSNLENLRYGTQDALHQPHRAVAVYPYLNPVIEAAIGAGACAAFLSGAGPTVMALTSGVSGDIFTQRAQERVDRKVADAMIKAAEKQGIKGIVSITAPVIHGAYVVHAEPAFSHGKDIICNVSNQLGLFVDNYLIGLVVLLQVIIGDMMHPLEIFHMQEDINVSQVLGASCLFQPFCLVLRDQYDLRNDQSVVSLMLVCKHSPRTAPVLVKSCPPVSAAVVKSRLLHVKEENVIHAVNQRHMGIASQELIAALLNAGLIFCLEGVCVCWLCLSRMVVVGRLYVVNASGRLSCPSGHAILGISVRASHIRLHYQHSLGSLLCNICILGSRLGKYFTLNPIFHLAMPALLLLAECPFGQNSSLDIVSKEARKLNSKHLTSVKSIIILKEGAAGSCHATKDE